GSTKPIRATGSWGEPRRAILRAPCQPARGQGRSGKRPQWRTAGIEPAGRNAPAHARVLRGTPEIPAPAPAKSANPGSPAAAPPRRENPESDRGRARRGATAWRAQFISPASVKV